MTIAEAIQKSGKSKQYYADELGMSPQLFGYYVRRNDLPLDKRGDFIKALNRGLNVTEAELFPASELEEVKETI